MRKRRKYTHNFFIDDEAGHSDNGTEHEVVDDEEVEIDDDEDTMYHEPRNTQPSEQDNNVHWQSFIRRAEARGRNTRFEYDGQQSSNLEGWERLWEIGCKVGHEEKVAFKALDRARHPNNPVKFVIGCASIPGRVFVEVHSETDARSFAISFAELNPNTVRMVPVEELLSMSYIKNPFSFDGTHWARLTGRGPGWGIYKGDIAMVVPRDGVKIVVVIPRIKTSDSIDIRKPQQSLFPAHVLRELFDHGCISSVSPNGSFTFKGRRFTKEGFLYRDLSEVDVFRPADDLPTDLEFETFKECSLMDDKVFNDTALRLSLLKVVLGARVVVMEGDFKGLVGRVVEMADNEVAVDVESQDHVERVNLSSVRVAFKLGDQVQINQGPYSGKTGWIVDVRDLMVTVINVEQGIDISIKKSDVGFYNSPFVTTLRKRTLAGNISLRGDNPNKIYHGKRVIVVGANHYKSYKGVIKYTNIEGYAWVELEARMQLLEQISLDGLALLSKDEISMVPIKIQKDAKWNPVPLASGSVSVRSTTPVPEAVDAIECDDAWNPNSATPKVQRPTHWLDSDKLQATRLQLYVSENPNVVLEFKGVFGDEAKVRDGRKTKMVPLDDLHGVPPTAKGDLVTARIGSMVGVALKVREYASDKCVVRQPGKVLKKRETDPTIPTANLIQIYPYV